jgi:three-Cys-motif partner protein
MGLRQSINAYIRTHLTSNFLTMTDSFFSEQKEQSLIKARIVEKYFWAWAKVVIPTARKISPKNPQIAYVDLFTGPGRYEDGSKSTPIKILEKAIADLEIAEMLVTLFNDVDHKSVNSLQESIKNLYGIKKLKFPPEIMNEEVGDNIVKLFEEKKLVPTLFFVDPWGYKGLSLKLINSVVKDWRCDCIFFFNYNRINMGLPNSAVKPHLDALFEEKRADVVRQKLNTGKLSPQDREVIIIEAICEALKEMGGKLTLHFRFKNENGNRTSHHLVFVTKNEKGYNIMKDIMAKESSEHIQGVPSFEYSPTSKNNPHLPGLYRPLDKLEEILLDDFSGQTLTMEKLFEQHNIGKPYIRRNYVEVLNKLEESNKIQVKVAQGKKRRKVKGQFADHLIVIFPSKQ